LPSVSCFPPILVFFPFERFSDSGTSFPRVPPLESGALLHSLAVSLLEEEAEAHAGLRSLLGILVPSLLLACDDPFYFLPYEGAVLFAVRSLLELGSARAPSSPDISPSF